MWVFFPPNIYPAYLPYPHSSWNGNETRNDVSLHLIQLVLWANKKSMHQVKISGNFFSGTQHVLKMLYHKNIHIKILKRQHFQNNRWDRHHKPLFLIWKYWVYVHKRHHIEIEHYKWPNLRLSWKSSFYLKVLFVP